MVKIAFQNVLQISSIHASCHSMCCHDNMDFNSESCFTMNSTINYKKHFHKVLKLSSVTRRSFLSLPYFVQLFGPFSNEYFSPTLCCHFVCGCTVCLSTLSLLHDFGFPVNSMTTNDMQYLQFSTILYDTCIHTYIDWSPKLNLGPPWGDTPS